MRRREFIASAFGATFGAPTIVRGQRTELPVVGFLSDGSFENIAPARLPFFRAGLRELGYVEGQNVEIEYRWAGGRQELLPELATNLVNRRPAVIATFGPYSVRAARAAAGSTPITFYVGADPVASGLVERINRPGGNLTGLSVFANVVQQKRLELFRKLLPDKRAFAYLANPTVATYKSLVADTLAASELLGIGITIVDASNTAEIETAFARIRQLNLSAVFVSPNTLFIDRGRQITELALRYLMPTSFEFRDTVALGGFMSYGPNFNDGYRQIGQYVGRILKGEKPGDLPVQLPTKYELVINLKTAKALGLTIPETLLATADEVIQ
jgi:putative tryptophan/tyrosine transport system substrate-binding protein